jgi:hypothetical protein
MKEVIDTRQLLTQPANDELTEKAVHRLDVLGREIVALSESKVRASAFAEWELAFVFEQDEGSCLCTHYPIVKHCQIRNKLNGRETIVGSCCIRQFFGFNAEPIFAGLRRILDLDRAPNLALISYAFERSIINDWEFDFSMSTFRKRILTPKRVAVRRRINVKLLNHSETGLGDRKINALLNGQKESH